eukprot:COSAG06_NODE_36916_length_441_cov_1.242690_1_plen_70_part_00
MHSSRCWSTWAWREQRHGAPASPRRDQRPLLCGRVHFHATTTAAAVLPTGPRQSGGATAFAEIEAAVAG